MSVGGYLMSDDDGESFAGRVWDATFDVDFVAKATPASAGAAAPDFDLWAKSPEGNEFMIGTMRYESQRNRKHGWLLFFYVHGAKIEASAKEDSSSAHPQKMTIVPYFIPRD